MYILLAILLYLHFSIMLNAGLKWSIFFLTCTTSFTTGPFAMNAAFVSLLCLSLSFIYYSECFPLFGSHFHSPVCSALLQI